MAITVADLLVVLRGDATSAVAAAGQTDAALAGTAASAEAASASVAASSSRMSSSMALIGVGAVGAGIAVIEMGANFDAQMSKVQGFAGVAADQMAGLKASVLDLSRATGESATQIAQGLYFAESAGLKTGDAMTVLSRSTRLAMADMTDAKTVVDITTSAMNAYGVGADQLAHIQDVLTATTVAGKLHMSELAATLGPVLSIAATAGVSLEQLGASLATMTEKGINSQLAVTSIRQTILALEAPTKQTRTEMAALGVSVDEVRTSIREKGYLQTLDDLVAKTGGNLDAIKNLVPNVRALSGVLSDTGQSGQDYVAAQDKIQESSGKSQAAIDIYAATSQASIHRFTAAATTDLIEFGSKGAAAIAPLLDELVRLNSFMQSDTGQAIFTWANELLRVTPGIGGAVSIFEDLYGTLTEGSNKAAPAVLKLTSAIDADAADLANAGSIMAQAARGGLAEVATAYDKITAAVQRQVDQLPPLGQAYGMLGGEIDSLKTQTGDLKFGPVEPIQPLIDMTSQLGVAYGLLGGTIDTLKTQSGDLKFDAVGNQVDLLIQKLQGTQKEADTARIALTNLFTQPTKEMLTLQADIDKNRLSIDQWNADLANSSPIDQRIAALTRQLDTEQRTGASASQVAKTQGELNAQLAAVPAAEGAAVQSGERHADQLDRTNKVLSDQKQVLSDKNQLMADTTKANQAGTLSEADLEKAYGAANNTIITTGNPANVVLQTQADLLSKIATNGVAATSALAGYASTMGSALGAGAGSGNMKFPATGGSGFAMPVSDWQSLLTQAFGPTDEPREPAGRGYAHFHSGVDLGVGMDTSLAAGGAGTIIQAGPNGGYGNSVTIDLGGGLTELLGHLDSIAVTVGQAVSAGQTVGLSGSTGNSSGPHVHVEVDQNGVAIDPTSLLGTVLAGQPGTTATANLDLSTSASGSSSGGLPPAWYAAIQANESSLPLPSPGSPEPMFGIGPGFPYAVDTQHYTSGDVNPADADPGQPVGTSTQSRFASVADGMRSLDQWWRQYPDAVQAVTSGDFSAFIDALMRHGYAGPAGWNPAMGNSRPTLGTGNPAAFGTPGQLPVPAPESASGSTPSTRVSENRLDTLTTKSQTTANELAVAQSGTMTGADAGDLADFEEKAAKIPALLKAAQDAQKQYNEDVASGTVDQKTLGAELDNLNRTYDALNKGIGTADDAYKTLTTDQTTAVTASDNLAKAQQQYADETAPAVGAAAKEMTQAQVDSDKARLDSISQTAAGAAGVAEMWQQRVLDDITNHVTPEQLAADKAQAAAAEKNSALWYTYWHNAHTDYISDLAKLTAAQNQQAQQALDNIHTQIALNNELATSLNNIVHMQATLAVVSAENSTAIGQGMVSSANAAIAAYNDASAAVARWDQILGDADLKLTTAQQLVIKGERDKAAAAQASALTVAQTATAAANTYANAYTQAQSAISQGEKNLFDLRHTLTHLSGDEQAAGLGQIISAEISYQEQIDAIEWEISNTNDQVQLTILNATLHRLQRELDATKEAEREKRVQMQDTANAAGGGGHGGGGGGGGGGAGGGPGTASYAGEFAHGGMTAAGNTAPSSAEYVMTQMMLSQNAVAGGAYGQYNNVNGPGGGVPVIPGANTTNVAIVIQLNGETIANAIQQAQTQNMHLNVTAR